MIYAVWRKIGEKYENNNFICDLKNYNTCFTLYKCFSTAHYRLWKFNLLIYWFL